jgi:UDPglucose 6-dehydrogenase/GDP-mannose 6-dehydrogenase
MRVSIVGTGYVGLVSGACLAEVGHDCTCVDIDQAKVNSINAGRPPIHESGLEDLLRRNVGSRLRATSDLRAAVVATDVTLIAVGTPFDGSRIDLRYIREAAREIGAALREKSSYHVVVVKSTVVPGTTDEVVLPMLEEASGKRAGVDFGVGMNPEFLTEGVAVNDFMAPDRIVLGGIDGRTIDTLAELYAGFPGVPVMRTNNKTAEMIKYASNATLATLISFANEIGNLCATFEDLDVADVMTGVHLAHYFSPILEDGRRVRAPISAFLWAGCGFGGSCLPKDVKALSAHGAARGQPMRLLDEVIRINQAQPQRVVRIVEERLGTLSGKRIAVLGLAFKQETDDVRESPAIPVVRMLVERGAEVKAYDPVALQTGRAVLAGLPVQFSETLEDVVKLVEAVVICTRWDEFRRVPALLARDPASPWLVDGRRMLEPQSYTRYAGIGRW